MSARRGECAAVRARLPLFVGGDLEAALARSIGTHLRGCPGCRGEASAQLQARLGLARAAAAANVRGVDEAMFASLHATVMTRVTSGAAPMQRVALRRAAFAVAAGVLFAVGWLAARPGGGLLGRPPMHGPRLPIVDPVGFGQTSLQPLGHERHDAQAADWAQAPMRPVDVPVSLRTLEDGSAILGPDDLALLRSPRKPGR